MGQAFGACFALGFAVAVVGMLTAWFQQKAGGAFLLYYWETASSDIQSSVSLSLEGLFAALRLEEAGVGLSVVITPQVLGTFLLVRLVTTAVAAPFQVGCMDNLWAVRMGAPKRLRDVFRWYIDLKKAGKAIFMQVFLWVEKAVLTVVFSLPALALLSWFPVTTTLFSAALWLLLLGQAAVWCVMTQFEPVRYQLARHPELGVGGALGYGRAVLTRRRGAYLKFHLSFALWELLNNATQGMMNLYLYPYQGLANMEFLLETESRIRQEYGTPSE